MYAKQLSPQITEVSGRHSKTKTQIPAGAVALHLDFVAKPEGTALLHHNLGEVFKHAGLIREGLETGLLLVSDREARLVTLLTFWDAQRFAAGRERRIAWMQKLLAPFADGPIRAQTSTARFVLSENATTFAGEQSPEIVEEFARMAG